MKVKIENISDNVANDILVFLYIGSALLKIKIKFGNAQLLQNMM